MNKITTTIALTASMLALTSMSASASTLKSVQENGYLQCGVSTGLPGFSSADAEGNWQGLDVEFCRAVAAATLGDASKVKFTPLTAKERFTALQSGEIDLLSRNSTWTFTRDVSLGLNFAGVNFYDGQGFMVNKNIGVNSVLELDGATICIQAGTTSELNVADFFSEHNMKYTPVTYDTADATRRGFETGRCDVITSDKSKLYAIRIQLKNPADAKILPEVISKEPLGPVVRQGDDQWFNIVRWTHNVMLNAEELGVTSENAASKKNSDNPAIVRLLTGQGSKIGLDDKWAYNIITQVGNYAESFDRNVGMGSPLKIERGLNALWKDGGLQYAPPIR